MRSEKCRRSASEGAWGFICGFGKYPCYVAGACSGQGGDGKNMEGKMEKPLRFGMGNAVVVNG